MWFQPAHGEECWKKKQVEKCLCLVGHGSAVPLYYLDPGKKLLRFKEVLLHLLHGKNVIRKKKKGELAVQREETGIIPFPGLFPLSLRQTGSGSDLWLLRVGSFLRLLLRDSRNSNSALTWKSLLAQLDEQGSPHRLYLAEDIQNSELQTCFRDLCKGNWLQSVTAMGVLGVLNPASLWLLGLSESQILMKCLLKSRNSMWLHEGEDSTSASCCSPCPNYPKVHTVRELPGKLSLKIPQFFVLPMHWLALGPPLPAFAIPIILFSSS